MERELTRRCRRSIRVAEFVTDTFALRAVRTGGREVSYSERKMPLFAGFVEVLYARKAWLIVRVDIWTSRDICLRQVKCASVYLIDQEVEVVKDAMPALHRVETLGLSMAGRGKLPALTGDELTNALEEVVMQIVDTFRVLQAQTASQRAKFEYEMLQHLPDLEVLVLTSPRTGNYALFALPLLGEKPQLDPKSLVEKEDLDLVYIPDRFEGPNFSATTDGLTILIGYPMEEDTKSDAVWALVLEWPANMLLSSEVTQTPPSSKTQSSVELIASCEKMFLQQWRRRKAFIGELRRRVIGKIHREGILNHQVNTAMVVVFWFAGLEYDAVDFSQVYFMLQEQLNEQAPVRIVILRLQFTAAFFLTNCMSDLQVTLLDGEEGAAPVVVALSASTMPSSPDPTADSQPCVAQFLEFTRKSLLRHFYGE
ncbi:hypothetical protein PHMEG_00015851 [Phytophthora megakarya]|uniref:Uncharacterized protein n=1 Tax=Phytophthora megakarya TaxID=4795 RepID=A0A225W085_9STRA|nr:hypothetical protein PHMEG_00015851 [Phytophthora megakarya]